MSHTEHPRVALNGRIYEVDRFFAGFDPAPGRICDVTVDAQDNIYVLLRYDRPAGESGPAVVVISPEGARLRSFGEAEVFDAHLLSAGPDGLIWVVDRDAHQVLAFSPEGVLIRSLGSRHAPLAPFNHPTDVAFTPEGDILVSDGYAASLLHRFAADGSYKGAIGDYGDGEGEWIAPHALWVLRDGRTALLDRDSNRVFILRPDGSVEPVITRFHKPMAIWGDAEDRLYITDLTPALHCLTAEGAHLGRARPALNGAHGICGDSQGRIYLAEGNPNRVLCMRPLL